MINNGPTGFCKPLPAGEELGRGLVYGHPVLS